MKTQVLIIDSDSRQIQKIEKVVKKAASKWNKATEFYSARNIVEADKILQNTDIDLLVLDTIYKGRGKGEYPGIDFVKRLRRSERYLWVPVIFISSAEKWREYAYKELNCLGYLERAFDRALFLTLLDRALQYGGPQNKENHLFLRKKGVLYTVKVKEIVWVYVKNHLLCVHLDNGECLRIPNKTLSELCENAKTADLIRCNRNVLVNKMYVSDVNWEENYLVIKENSTRFPIGARYKEAVRNFIR